MNKQAVAKELVSVAKMLARVGDLVPVVVRGLDDLLGNYSIDHPKVISLIEKALRVKGYGPKMRGVGPYGSDYWERGGKTYRVSGMESSEQDTVLMEEIMLPFEV